MLSGYSTWLVTAVVAAGVALWVFAAAAIAAMIGEMIRRRERQVPTPSPSTPPIPTNSLPSPGRE